MDTVARWIGWDQINLRLAQEEIQRLNQLLAEAKLGKKDDTEK